MSRKTKPSSSQSSSSDGHSPLKSPLASFLQKFRVPKKNDDFLSRTTSGCSGSESSCELNLEELIQKDPSRNHLKDKTKNHQINGHEIPDKCKSDVLNGHAEGDKVKTDHVNGHNKEKEEDSLDETSSSKKHKHSDDGNSPDKKHKDSHTESSPDKKLKDSNNESSSRPMHKDSHDKSSSSKKHKDSHDKSSSSSRDREPSDKIKSGDSHKESHKSSSDKHKESHRSPSDKSKESHKSSSSKSKDSHRSSSSSSKDSHRSPSHKSKESHRSSSDKSKESHRSSSDKHKDSHRSSSDRSKESHRSSSDKTKESLKSSDDSKKESSGGVSAEQRLKIREKLMKFQNPAADIRWSPIMAKDGDPPTWKETEKRNSLRDVRNGSKKDRKDASSNSCSKPKENHGSSSTEKDHKPDVSKKLFDSPKKKIETISDSDSEMTDFSQASKKEPVKKIETISDSDSNSVTKSGANSDVDKTPMKNSKPRNDNVRKKETISDSDGTPVKNCKPKHLGKEAISDSDRDSPVKVQVKKKRKVVINDDSDEEEDDSKKNLKKKRRVMVQSESDSEEENKDTSKKKPKSDEESDPESDVDNEYQPEYSASKIKILSFLSECPENDLMQVTSMTKRKIDIIAAKRPYSSYSDLVDHLKSNSIPLGLLDNVSELLKAREVFSKLMNKVAKISKETAATIKSSEGKLKRQSSLLDPELTLADYQIIGVNWLAVLHSLNMSGILADEMGLGKTVQVISFLAHLKEKKLASPKKPHLIVVPSSTLANWENELHRWCPSMGFEIYHGNVEERREMRFKWLKNGFGNTEVILTTYNCVSNNPEDFKLTKHRQFHCLVFDEAHMLKNMNTQRYIRLFNIKAKFRLLLTGTPLQNNLLELMSLLHFTIPAVFSENLNSIKFLFGKMTKPINSHSPDFEREKVEQVKKLMEPFVLRRLKTNVLKNLPKKEVHVIKCPMTSDQAAKYNELLVEFKETESFENLYMTMVTSLRKMANHPCLLRYHYEEDKIEEMAECLALDPDYKDTNVQYIKEDLLFMSDFELNQLSDNFKCLRYERFRISESLFKESGKFKKLDELLPTLKKDGHRVLIFSQFLMILDLLEKYLAAKDLSFRRLDGSTLVPDRQELIDDFNSDPSIFCFLLSTKAGGLGINLTAADTVIIHDLDINPYNDKQAEDRCHRVGQKRPVTVYKFLSEDTIEEDVYKVTQSKLNLEQEVTSTVDEAAEKETFAALLRRTLGLAQNSMFKKS